MKLHEAPAPRRKTGSAFPLEHVLAIGVDKFKLALLVKHTDDALVDFIEQQLADLEKGGAKRKSVKGRAFRNCLSVRVGNDHLRIEWSPNRTVYPYWLTVEFNPNPYLRAGAEAVRELASFFRLLFGVNTARIMSQALVLRMDVNIDFDINVLEGTLVSMKEKRGGANVMRDFDGKGTLATLYVGVLGSDCRLTVYDKAAETLRRELKSTAWVTLAALASPKDWQLVVRKLQAKEKEKTIPEHWRMEVRCQRKGGYLLSEVAGLASSFDGVRLFHLQPDRAPFNTSLGRTFMGLACHVGIEVALQALDNNDRRSMQRAISRLDQIEWFNAEILRDYIKAAIERLAPMFCAPGRPRLPGASQQQVPTRSLPVKQPPSVPARQQAITTVLPRALKVGMRPTDQSADKRVRL
ncbi:hypothetical protein DR64_103 [Paraburkholderia xenovorans LB400]|uniref:Replication initiation factor n=1 Tax=Paraburkholderia xenovorans (strain LB400) TaxID=266265 RepID=Q13ZC0_PARXL|nr:hypothetical protein [Paraburkholderia xenovorans]ABE30569.1 hypothetical protein Bxe_A2400 [Paraburkholderia xenovorans LB400]AIP30232.1 hypothetical protein DR64_103 [Paraburkholderia xenovorans LB400]